MKPIRRAQAISPFGIGAIVDFPGAISLIHAGLDAWPFNSANIDHSEFIINDELRLARRLGVDYFVLPPDYRTPSKGVSLDELPNTRLTLPFHRFPLWHVCPVCGRMEKSAFEDRDGPRCRGLYHGKHNSHKERVMTQVRFIAACPDGHLSDFPWVEWLFEGNVAEFRPDSVELRLRNRGQASLSGLEITAEMDIDGVSKVIKSRTLNGAFGGKPENNEPSAITKVYGHCRGHNPVLGIPSKEIPEQSCSKYLYAMLRGSTSLYIPKVTSSIFIPENHNLNASEEINDLLEDDQFISRIESTVLGADSGKLTPRNIRPILNQLAPDLAETVDIEKLVNAANSIILPKLFFYSSEIEGRIYQWLQLNNDLNKIVEKILQDDKRLNSWGISATDLIPYLKEKLDADEGSSENSNGSPITEEINYRYREFKVLRHDYDIGKPKKNLLICSNSISDYSSSIQRWFSRISLVKKLRETRAFCGFSRILPDDRSPLNDKKWALIAHKKKDWLPAIIIRGEGIFFEFNSISLNEWESNISSRKYHAMENSLNDLRQNRLQEYREITPKFVLLHTFAHIIINQLVYECGYGSSALRERIYSSNEPNDMAGVLIYTAAGDSEGTMGGLVAMGDPGRLERVIANAIEKARWCSSDPVCSESQGQGPGSCNLAACHACALLPETACEEQNMLLDRATLIGTIDNPELGFFNSLI